MDNSSKWLKLTAQYVACALLIATILLFTKEHWGEFSAVKQVRPITLFWLSVCFIGGQALGGVALKLLVSVFSIELRFQEWFGLVWIRSFGNYLPLSAGLTANATYLKMQRDLPVTKFASLMAGNVVLSALTGSILGAVLSLWRYRVTGHVQLALLGLFLAVVLVGVLLITLPLRTLKTEGRVANWIRSTHEGWETIRARTRLMLTIVALHFSMLVLIGMQYKLLLTDMGYEMDWPAIMIMTVATNIIRFATLFPGNLGMRELVAGGVAQAFGFSFNGALLASSVGRVMSMFWVFLFGTAYLLVFVNTKRKSASQ